MRVVPVKEQVLQPRHLRAEYQKRYLEYEEVRYQVPDDGILERSFLEETIQKYGVFFRLFIDDLHCVCLARKVTFPTSPFDTIELPVRKAQCARRLCEPEWLLTHATMIWRAGVLLS